MKKLRLWQGSLGNISALPIHQSGQQGGITRAPLALFISLRPVVQ